MGINHQEVEWQFDAASLEQAERWLRARSTAGDLQFHFLSTEEHRDGYYDTSDWRFFTAGYALRLRIEGERAEVTLKSFGAERHDEPLRRHELTQVASGLAAARNPGRALEHLDGDVGARVRAVVGKAHLTRLFEVRTKRQRVGVHVDDAKVAEVSLDDVVIAAPRRRAARLRRVEIELQDAQAADKGAVRDFVAAFRAECGLTRAEQSKFQAGVQAYGLDPRRLIDLGHPEAAAAAGDDPTMGGLAFAVMREHFAQFLLREPGSRLGEDAEQVHRMRVATRRLRAAMSLFRDYLPEQAGRLRDELGWVARALGSVRDLDVQLERIQEWHTDGGSLNPEALRGLEALLCSQREHARTGLLHTLDSERYERFVADFSALLRAGPGGTAAALKHARNEIPSLVLKRYVKVRSDGDAIDVDSPAESLHELRIQCKRLRYALEFVEHLYPKAMRAYLERLVDLQDLLGQHQDAHVAIEQMRGLGLTHQHELPAHTVFTLGEIAQRYAHQAETLRARFPKAYRRIKGKPWQQLQRALDDAQGPSR